MSERFLYDVLREAPPPRRRRRWWAAQLWTLPVGLCVGFAAYALYDGRWQLGLGFAVGGWLTWVVLKDMD